MFFDELRLQKENFLDTEHLSIIVSKMVFMTSVKETTNLFQKIQEFIQEKIESENGPFIKVGDLKIRTLHKI